MPDPITAIGLGIIVYKPTQEFLKKLTGPAADEFGQWLAERVRKYRVGNIERTLADANRLLKDAGKEPREVHPKTLFPILEGAGLEDDVELSKRWAALLAQAGDPSQPNPVYPIFANILRQLTPLDARLLDIAYEITLTHPTADWKGIPRATIAAHASVEQDPDFFLSIDSLIALGLLIREPSVRMSSDVIQTPYVTGQSEVALTALGYRFTATCQPPIRQCQTDN
jgi:hypothetical protein